MKRLSTLFYSILVTGAAYAQIPNAGFENWTAGSGISGAYSTPDNWANPNPTLSAFPGMTYTVTKGTPGYAGAAYVKLISQSEPSIGVVPGIVGTGTATVSGTTFTVTGGFPNTTRPATLTGAWQYNIASGDTGHVMVYLYKWNTVTNREDTIAYADKALTGTVPSWTAFYVSLSYYRGATPDSARIILSSGKLPPATGIAGSSLYVDTLAFIGTVPSGVVTIRNNAAPTIIFPNPASGNANVFYYSMTGGAVTLSLSDMSGRQIKTMNMTAAAGANTFPVNVSELPHGMYLLNITDGSGGVEEKKIMVQ